MKIKVGKVEIRQNQTFFAQFWEILKKHLAANLKKESRLGAGVRLPSEGQGAEPPAGLVKGIIKWSGKVGLGKV